MKIFITGASGYLGNRLVHKLADAGNIIHALVRDISNPALQHPNIRLFKGDIRNAASITML